MTTDVQQDDSHGQLLDKIYSFQRHIYDITRKYFLFGRDRLIEKLAPSNPNSVLELGCGTGRNLFLLEKRLQNSKLFGIDASQEMLKQASKSQPKDSTVQFAFGYAESFNQNELFGVESFSAIFFSYSLSMMPDWKGALEKSLKVLEPGGEVWIVDFWDQGGYPAWFQKGLQKWLELFHVRFEPLLLEYLYELESSGRVTLSVEPVGKRYGYLAKVTPL